MNRGELRRKLTARRRRIPRADARRAGLDASRRAWKLQLIQRADRIAAYIPMRGELDCRAMIQRAWDQGRRVYLPVLHRQELRFRAYTPSTRMRPNRFGIPEPASGEELSATALDVVITPLVAFDLRGNRLGMGGGYYDRSFRFLQHRNDWRHPRLVGFAYQMQCMNELHNYPWDVSLDAAVTESASFVFSV